MKKILIIIIIVFGCMIKATNIGSSNSNSIETRYSSIDEINKKLIEYNRIKINDMINSIEYESEIDIPDHVDVQDIEYIYNIANELQIPIRIVFRLVHVESRFNDTIVSPEGAKGYFQLMPSTYKMYMKKLNLDTLKMNYNQRNAYIGLYMLKNLHNHWTEIGYKNEYAWKLTLASYNAGIGKVIKYKGIPPYKETNRYINIIMKKRLINEDTVKINS